MTLTEMAIEILALDASVPTVTCKTQEETIALVKLRSHACMLAKNAKYVHATSKEIEKARDSLSGLLAKNQSEDVKDCLLYIDACLKLIQAVHA